MRKIWPIFLLIFISATVVIFFYGKPLSSPNAYMFSESGDGLKNYYTYYYHIAHDSSATAFEGMNFPYGEHTLYTDCHPIVSNTLRCIGGENMANNSIGVINLMIILSIFFTFIILYFLMRQLGVKPWIALLFSIGIGLLAPQIFRITGHLSLSYSIAIPLAWLLVVRIFNSERKWIPLLLLLIANIFWLFIHAYLGMIIISFQMAFWLMLMIIRRKAWKPLTHILFVLIFVLPIIFFQVYLRMTDEHVGRTDNPSGFFLYNAEPDDVFLPHHPPLRPLLNKINGLDIDQEWEAWSYIGLSFTIMMIVFLFSWVYRLFRIRKGILYKNFTDNFLLNISMLAAILVLLFAFAFPFKMFPGLTDIIPYIKQFRATGRFAWVFYFTASVYAVYMLQQIFLRLKSKPVLAYSIVIIAGLMSIAEGLPYHSEASAKISVNKNIFLIENTDQEFISALSNINPDEFQAIIPLPFFHYGSETFARPLNDASVKNSMLLSAYTGLPQMSAYLTRSSVQESRNIIQLMSPPWYKKEIAPDLKSDKDFLIISSGDTFTDNERMIIHRSNKLYLSLDFSLYKISKNILLQNTSRQEKEEFSLMHEMLFEKEGFLLTDSNAWFYYNPFEDLPSDHAFRGDGAYNGMKAGKNTFAEFDPNTFESGKTYIISTWMYNGEKDALNLWFRFMVEEYDARNDRWHITTVFPEQSEVICGDWSLVELTFTVKDATNGIAIVSKGKDNSKAALYLDDLLIRESGAEIYRMQDDGLFYNNHQIK